MSFWSSLCYYRPTPPPVVTSADLLEFVEGFRDCAVSVEQSTWAWYLKVKYGESIDQDDLPTTWDEPIEDLDKPTWWQRVGRLLGGSGLKESTVTISTSAEIDWDCDRQYEGLTQLAEGIRGLDSQEKVYRAHVGFGTATDSVIRSLERVNSPENEIDLQLSDWFLEIGPIDIHDLASDHVYSVGWISLDIAGDGYLFPWKPKDLVRRADASPEMNAVAKLCRDVWPVASARPDTTRMKHRRILGELWPYPIDAPVNWAWGVQETG